MLMRLLVKFTKLAKIAITTRSNCLRLSEPNRKDLHSSKKLKITNEMTGSIDR